MSENGENNNGPDENGDEPLESSDLGPLVPEQRPPSEES